MTNQPPTSSKSHLIAAALGTLGCIQFQPGLFGQNLGFVLIGLSLSLVGCLLVTQKASNLNYMLWALLFCYPAYTLCISLSIGAWRDGLKGFILYATHATLLVAMLSAFGVSLMKRCFVWTMLVVASLLIVTTLLRYSSVVAHAGDVSFEIKHYNTPAILLAPFAIYWPRSVDVTILNVDMPRAIGIFREPGVFQAFLCAAMLSLGGVLRRKYLILGLAVLTGAVILTLSTAGFVNLFLVAAILPFSYDFSRKTKAMIVLVTMVAAVSAFYLYFYQAEGGLESKLQTVSGRERVDAVDELKDHIGTARILGLRSQYLGDLVVSQTGSIPSFILWEGIAGFGLSLAPVIWFLFRAKKIRNLVPAIPVLITALTSQPLWSTGPLLTILALAMHESYFPGSAIQRLPQIRRRDRAGLSRNEERQLVN